MCKRELSTDIELEKVPLTQLPSSTEDIHVRTKGALQNTDLDMQEFLEIKKPYEV